MNKNYSLLEKERSILLQKWTNARGKDRSKLLAEIMFLDDEIEFTQRNKQKKQAVSF